MEAIMAGVVVPLAVALFLSGIAASAYVVIAIAVRREDRAYTLVSDAPGGLTRISRRLTGVGRRDLDPELLRPAGEFAR
jgi:formate-dependent nitrite reductase membrane component NrfD